MTDGRIAEETALFSQNRKYPLFGKTMLQERQKHKSITSEK